VRKKKGGKILCKIGRMGDEKRWPRQRGGKDLEAQGVPKKLVKEEGTGELTNGAGELQKLQETACRKRKKAVVFPTKLLLIQEGVGSARSGYNERKKSG